jgi:CDP-2,3-bis-(O-geranylgeranyl)-sn-glycerol synthase
MLIRVLAVLWLFVPAYVANMAPVLVRRHLEVLARPLDGGRSWRGVRILGDHKTWRGLLVGVAAGALVFEIQRAIHAAGHLHALALFDYGAAGHAPGVLLGLGALAGDAVKSFFKRRAGIGPGRRWIGPDQLDFYAGALVFLAPIYVPSLLPLALTLPVVFVGDVLTSAAGWLLGLKDDPI